MCYCVISLLEYYNLIKEHFHGNGPKSINLEWATDCIIDFLNVIPIKNWKIALGKAQFKCPLPQYIDSFHFLFS